MMPSNYTSVDFSGPDIESVPYGVSVYPDNKFLSKCSSTLTFDRLVYIDPPEVKFDVQIIGKNSRSCGDLEVFSFGCSLHMHDVARYDVT